jgi:hypothetical protein
MKSIILNDIEQKIVQYIARSRFEINRQNGVKNARKGKQSDHLTDLDGFGGEFAFCKLFNLYPDLEVKVTSQETDSGDCILNGKRIDIKTTKYKTGKLICALWKNDEIDYYALMVGEFPRYEFKGFAKASDVKKEENIINLGRGKLYAMEQKFLVENFS